MAEGAADLFECEEFCGVFVLDEVDVGEAALDKWDLVSLSHLIRRELKTYLS